MNIEVLKEITQTKETLNAALKKNKSNFKKFWENNVVIADINISYHAFMSMLNGYRGEIRADVNVIIETYVKESNEKARF